MMTAQEIASLLREIENIATDTHLMSKQAVILTMQIVREEFAEALRTKNPQSFDRDNFLKESSFKESK